MGLRYWLFLYKFGWVRRILPGRITARVIRECKQTPPELWFRYFQSQMALSRSAGFSKHLIEILIAFPDEIVEKDERLRHYFIRSELNSTSVKQGLAACKYALDTCLSRLD